MAKKSSQVKKTSKLAKYHNTTLVLEDVQALDALESMLGEVIPEEVEDFEEYKESGEDVSCFSSFGFVAKNNRVIGLWISGHAKSDDWDEGLPDEICQMTALEVLGLEKLQICELPDDIGKLEKLEFLDLCNTDIEDLPDSFVKLKSLETFWFTDTPLLELLQESDDDLSDKVKNFLVLNIEDLGIATDWPNYDKLHSILDTVNNWMSKNKLQSDPEKIKALILEIWQIVQ